MADTALSSPAERPYREGLFHLASEQRGYFTVAQARAYGYSRALLAHHTKAGTFRRIHRGVYRFRDYPSTPREEVLAAWLIVGKDIAVVSHESALDLWDLSDLIPDAVHLTVPRTRRHLPHLPDVTIHTTTRPLGPDDVRTLEGVRVTSPPRTLLDVAEAGGAPEQVNYAIFQAITRGWVDRDALRAAASQRGRRIARLVDEALDAHFSVYQSAE